MKTLATWMMGIALAASLPAPAAALDYSGLLSGWYDRYDTKTPGAGSTSSPMLQLDGNLSASDYVSAPEVFHWDAGLGYQRVRRSYLAGSNLSSVLAYNLGGGLYDSPNSKLRLTGQASRYVLDSSSSSAATPQTTGTTTDNSYGLRLSLQDGIRPNVWLGGSYRDSENSGFSRATVTETTSQLNAGISQGSGALNYVVDYSGRWNDGSLDALDYRFHNVSLNATTTVADKVDAYANGHYLLRIPDTVAATNPRSESNYVALGTRFTSPDTLGRGQYTYNHQLLSAPGMEPRERIQQSIQGRLDRTHAPGWTGIYTTELSTTQDRLGGSEATAAGESVSGLLRRQMAASDERPELLIEAGPTLGLLEPAGGDVLFGYGAEARARATWFLLTSRLAADYRIAYRHNLNAVRGGSLEQALSGEFETRFTRELRSRTTLVASSGRQDIQIFGTSINRTATLTSTLDWRRHELGAELGIQDGLSGELGKTVVSDGLFLPASFDTRSRYARLFGSASITPHLRISAYTRYAALSGPEAPNQRQADLSGIISYGLGLFQLSVEDRYTAAGASNFGNRVNEFIVRISRTFGGHI